jgi:hypothetical protein
VLSVHPAILVVLTIRNAMFFVILGWAVTALSRGAHPSDSGQDTLPRNIWPFKAPAVAQKP